jgi:hypothetical protein
MAPVTPPLNPIASLMLDDLRRAAAFLDELAAEYTDARRDQRSATAHAHAVRLWSATQAVERLTIAVENLIMVERSRHAYGNGDRT